MHNPTHRIAHTSAFVIPVVEHGTKNTETIKEENVLFNDAHNTF